MQPAPLHPNENERLESLRSFKILDTQGEDAYDELTQLASEIAGTEIALVSLIDEDRQWFKSAQGLDASETPRDLAFCAHAILTPDRPFVVEDASRDERFHDNPLVADGPAIRFYAGIPLRSPINQMPLGTLCAISPRVMSLSEEKIEQLRILGHQVERLLALRRANIDLLERSASLESARLAAEQANEAKTRFLATISHDMRTPLNGLVGTLGILDELLDNEEQREMAQTAESCARVLLQLVNDTLELSKIESGTIELSNAVFSPAKVIKETARVVASTLTEKKVELITTIDESTAPFLHGDELRCQQVVLNLLSNAAKFTEQGRISVHSQSVDGVWIVTVSDTGPGIQPEDLKSIFEPYIQSESGLLSHSGGAGLGLNICSRICKMLGGEVTVESALGIGSKFTAHMELPVSKAVIIESKIVAEELPTLNVLIAEDDRVSREILSAQLRRLGCTVTATADGNEAIMELHKVSFDLAILDYNMPGMTGPEVAVSYRETESSEIKLPIIALTARGFEDDRTACMAAGMDMMLTKPLNNSELETLLHKIVSEMPESAFLQPA